MHFGVQLFLLLFFKERYEIYSALFFLDWYSTCCCFVPMDFLLLPLQILHCIFFKQMREGERALYVVRGSCTFSSRVIQQTRKSRSCVVCFTQNNMSSLWIKKKKSSFFIIVIMLIPWSTRNWLYSEFLSNWTQNLIASPLNTKWCMTFWMANDLFVCFIA